MGKHIHRKKYKYITINGKTVREHRYIMEQHLRRKLSPKEVVHHKDGNGRNNDIDNLIVLPYNQHCKQERRKRPSDKLAIEDIKTIRKMLKDNIGKGIIAKYFNVHYRTIRSIELSESWAWLN